MCDLSATQAGIAASFGVFDKAPRSRFDGAIPVSPLGPEPDPMNDAKSPPVPRPSPQATVDAARPPSLTKAPAKPLAKPPAKADRLAEALRANLRRRKAQARGRDAIDDPSEPSGDS
jgi:hypothetical protein